MIQIRKWLAIFFNTPSHHKESDNSMKYLIVGLGNIGQEYKYTRHNIGFLVVEALAEKKDVIFTPNKQGDTAKFKHRGRSFILLKPSTYMNLSGKAVRYWMQKEKIPIERIIIIVDDLNLPFKKIRLRNKGSDGGHNGLKSINQVVGQNNYPRIRIGVGNDFHKGKQVDYVLGKWSEEESKLLPEIIDRTVTAILNFPVIGVARTMTELNKG